VGHLSIEEDLGVSVLAMEVEQLDHLRADPQRREVHGAAECLGVGGIQDRDAVGAQLLVAHRQRLPGEELVQEDLQRALAIGIDER
jgi:hypothetical protein